MMRCGQRAGDLNAMSNDSLRLNGPRFIRWRKRFTIDELRGDEIPILDLTYLVNGYNIWMIEG